VSNRGSNTVSVIDTASNTVIATVPVGSAPEGVDISPDGNSVFVVNSGDGSVGFISTSNLAIVGAVAVGTNPQARGRFIGGSSQVTSVMPGPLTGLFWNPNESGWGIHLTQRGDTVFAAFFTYGSEGAPR
jgi:YVTN family beta-propeller protein